MVKIPATIARTRMMVMTIQPSVCIVPPIQTTITKNSDANNIITKATIKPSANVFAFEIFDLATLHQLRLYRFLFSKNPFLSKSWHVLGYL